jgi:hypothetical protein
VISEKNSEVTTTQVTPAKKMLTTINKNAAAIEALINSQKKKKINFLDRV